MQRASWLFALAAVFTLAACGDDSGTGPAPAASATLELRNDANVPITMMHIAPCSEAEWGENRLAGGESVAPADGSRLRPGSRLLGRPCEHGREVRYLVGPRDGRRRHGAAGAAGERRLGGGGGRDRGEGALSEAGGGVRPPPESA